VRCVSVQSEINSLMYNAATVPRGNGGRVAVRSTLRAISQREIRSPVIRQAAPFNGDVNRHFRHVRQRSLARSVSRSQATTTTLYATSDRHRRSVGNSGATLPAIVFSVPCVPWSSGVDSVYFRVVNHILRRVAEIVLCLHPSLSKIRTVLINFS